MWDVIKQNKIKALKWNIIILNTKTTIKKLVVHLLHTS